MSKVKSYDRHKLKIIKNILFFGPWVGGCCCVVIKVKLDEKALKQAGLTVVSRLIWTGVIETIINL